MVLAASADAAQVDRPPTIPALRSWHGTGGTFALRRDARVVVPHSDRTPASLREAWTLARDLRGSLGRPVGVATGAPVRRGDVVLEIAGRHAGLGREGYRLRIGRAFTIKADRAAGAFYGGRTLLQLLSGSRRIPRGLATDRPRYPERGLMIDLGRRVYRAAWIRREIRQLAYLKLNLLHLHLTDDQRWGIESDRHPELASPGALSKAQVRSLVAYARRWHVTVVPEIDMPGHIGALLAKHPGLALRKPGESPGATATRLDITDPAALRFVRGLIREYLPLFPDRYWHVGADEYMSDGEFAQYPQLLSYAQQHYGPDATAKDAMLGFINRIDGVVRAHGKTLRAWHDELGDGRAVSVNPDVIAEWWTPVSPLSDLTPPTPQELLGGGHRILNAGWFPTYFTGDVGPVEGKPDMRAAYEGWEVNEFAGPTIAGTEIVPRHVIAPSRRRNLGATINAWENTDLSNPELAAGLLPRLALIAQKTWHSPLLSRRYEDFEPLIFSLAGIRPGRPWRHARPSG
jgi:hexosaminidase